jgi:hypothetical protein
MPIFESPLVFTGNSCDSAYGAPSIIPYIDTVANIEAETAAKRMNKLNESILSKECYGR